MSLTDLRANQPDDSHWRYRTLLIPFRRMTPYVPVFEFGSRRN